MALLAGSAIFAVLRGVLLRRTFVTVCSAGFLATLLPDATHTITLVAFVLSGYLAARLLAWRPSSLLMVTYLTVFTLAFVVLKGYAFLRLLPGSGTLQYALDVVGLSFIFFRQIHYVVDARQGQIPAFTVWGYLCYQLNLFTLLAGPIQRYQSFHEDWQELTPRYADTHELRLLLLRVLLGVVKVAFLGQLCLRLVGQAGPWADLYLFPAYVYFNFAGYCDIVIAGAALAGLRLPENFQRPYLARNMIDFWTRWHRSLTFWIRDYVFTPAYVALARRQPARASELALVCYFVALFLAGVWHGASWNFVVFGTLHGAGVCAVKVWERWIVARRGRQGLRAYLSSPSALVMGRVATFHFACSTLLLLRPESLQSWQSWLVQG